MKNRLIRRATAVAASGLCVAGIAGAVAATASADAGAQHASATLRNAAGDVVGWVELTEDSTGTVHVNVHAEGMTPGLHGIHIHAVGSCSPDFAAAGGHHNPTAASHGSHSGDLPNLSVNVEGRGHLNSTTDHATLSVGPLSVFDADGSAVVVHAAQDDYVTNPAGNSGARIACGVINQS